MRYHPAPILRNRSDHLHNLIQRATQGPTPFYQKEDGTWWSKETGEQAQTVKFSELIKLHTDAKHAQGSDNK